MGRGCRGIALSLERYSCVSGDPEDPAHGRTHGVQPQMLRLPDLLSKGLDVVFCDINPALSAARAGHHFSSRSNRFWRVLYLAGFTPHLIPSESDRTILQYGCGLTAAVERPTVRASELRSREFHEAADELERKLTRYRPRYLAFLGKPAFAVIFRQRTVEWGQQSIRFGGAEVWVVPNPSGLNRAFSLDALVSSYRELWTASRQTRVRI
jgi:double-stranded uracil-DNA glycosylase